MKCESISILQSEINKLRSQIHSIASEVVEKQYNLEPNSYNYVSRGTFNALEHAKTNLDYLYSSVLLQSKFIFIEYIKWASILLKKINVPDKTIEFFYTLTKEVISEKILSNLISKSTFDIIVQYIDEGFKTINSNITEPETYIVPENPYFNELKMYQKYIFSSDKNSAINLIKDMLNKNTEIKHLYKYIFQPFQLELGRLWHLNMINVAQEHYSTATTQFTMSLLYEKIFATEKNGKILVGTCIKGELHELGIRMVCDYIESNGWDTHYLGANMPDNSIIQFIEDKTPHVVAISCTMPFNVLKVEGLIKKIKESNLNSHIIVGGYPFNIDNLLWEKVGADAYTRNFEEAYLTINQLL